MRFVTTACSSRLCRRSQVTASSWEVSGRRTSLREAQHPPARDVRVVKRSALPERRAREKNETIAEAGSKRSCYLLAQGGRAKDAERVLGSCFSGCSGAKGRAFDVLSRPGLAASTDVLSPAVPAGLLAASSPTAQSKNK